MWECVGSTRGRGNIWLSLCWTLCIIKAEEDNAMGWAEHGGSSGVSARGAWLGKEEICLHNKVLKICSAVSISHFFTRQLGHTLTLSLFYFSPLLCTPNTSLHLLGDRADMEAFYILALWKCAPSGWFIRNFEVGYTFFFYIQNSSSGPYWTP